MNQLATLRFSSKVRPLLNRVLEGERATFIAFGQTGTGKTHTVHGVEEELQKLYSILVTDLSSKKSKLSR